jgi:glycine/D-amino acid oxidase-like deaminating enzyme
LAYDVVIVGGGIMGSSTAYHLLAADPSLSVAVLERDPAYRFASTALTDGNVRIQFNLEENIRISQYTMQVLDSFADEMETPGLRPEPCPRREGNLFLVDGAGYEAAQRGLEAQRALGCRVEWLDAPGVGAEFPTLASHGLFGGTLGRDDGRVDAMAMLRGYRLKAIELGAEYLPAEALAITVVGGRVIGVMTATGPISAGQVLAAAGAWTSDLLRPLGVDLPVTPVMRTVYVVASTVATSGLPAVFLPSGLYAIPEGERTWVMAWSRDSDPVGFDFTPAGRDRFTDVLWPELVEHLPAFDSLHVESSWAGLYDVNTLDGNAILGEWPGIAGLHLAVGFSGHGFQQAPAVGRYLAEEIRGAPHELDLTRLGPQRIIDQIPLLEHAGRII